MKNLALFLILSLAYLPLKAQVSGYKGKKNVLTVSAQPFFWYTDPIGVCVAADYTRVITRNNAIAVQARMTSVNQTYASTSTSSEREKANIVQLGVFYEIYSTKSWNLAPIGFKQRFGITHTDAQYNIITTNEEPHPGYPAFTVTSQKGTSGKIAWQSLVYEVALRKPIMSNLCAIIGTGIEIPIAPLYSDIDIRTQLVRKSIGSRVLSLGLSYVF